MFKRKSIEDGIHHNENQWNRHNVTLKVTENEIKQKLSMLGITDETLKIMREQEALFEEHADEIVDQFYEKIKTIPLLEGIVKQHSTFERLKITQKQYFLSLTDGVVDEQYVMNRRKIGRVHDRIRLDSEWFFGAYQLYYKSVFPLLTKKYEGDPRLSEVLLAFTKLTTFDMQLVEETYIDSYTSKMLKLDDIKRLEKRLLDSSESLVANAEQTSTSVQNMYASSEEITAATEEATAHAEKVQEMALHSGKVVEDTLSQIHAIEEQMIQLQESTSRINEHSKKIGEIISLIHGIAKQTNILALNATIEAARAGEHGKGFAVVAGEVKNLAQSTQQALEDISDLIKKSHVAVEEMLSVVKQTNTSVHQGSKYTEQLQLELAEMMGGIHNNLEQVTTVSKQIKHLTEISEQISDSSQEVADLAEKLHYIGEELSTKLK
ncbi:globin-coupled sensor protein [Tepidibacillus decaturensis]|uniref:Methyl-accepting transducer domain-containing protein n=1 Tax=Tepidibacillus decaturensis TaxID=1413211 RepID=A0A135L5C4_9BACI|nr:globin-coupled sensor protein [Tepidibacillus decaturensis]KXG44107.1 hypothetical protein U473_08900 [Tepidibacillus decaturensis]